MDRSIAFALTLSLSPNPQRDVAADATTAKRLMAMSEVLTASAKDLLGLANASTGREEDNALNLSIWAAQSSWHLIAAADLLQVSEEMSAESDRRILQRLIRKRMPQYTAVLEGHLKHVSGLLAFTDKPAIADAGARVRDTLRSAKELLETVPQE